LSAREKSTPRVCPPSRNVVSNSHILSLPIDILPPPVPNNAAITAYLFGFVTSV
jgi:hypothetical protein